MFRRRSTPACAAIRQGFTAMRRRVLSRAFGLDFEYEAPTNAQLTIPFHELGATDVALRTSVDRVMALLEARGIIAK